MKEQFVYQAGSLPVVIPVDLKVDAGLWICLHNYTLIAFHYTWCDFNGINVLYQQIHCFYCAKRRLLKGENQNDLHMVSIVFFSKPGSIPAHFIFSSLCWLREVEGQEAFTHVWVLVGIHLWNLHLCLQFLLFLNSSYSPSKNSSQMELPMATCLWHLTWQTRPPHTHLGSLPPSGPSSQCLWFWFLVFLVRP